jgi:hypothetical protein
MRSSLGPSSQFHLIAPHCGTAPAGCDRAHLYFHENDPRQALKDIIRSERQLGRIARWKRPTAILGRRHSLRRLRSMRR